MFQLAFEILHLKSSSICSKLNFLLNFDGIKNFTITSWFIFLVFSFNDDEEFYLDFESMEN